MDKYGLPHISSHANSKGSQKNKFTDLKKNVCKYARTLRNYAKIHGFMQNLADFFLLFVTICKNLLSFAKLLVAIC